jgi:predicted DsbA family dithiol-disulfide isomerase
MLVSNGNIGDGDVLLGLAVDAGLDEQEVARVIAGDVYRDPVLASTGHAQSLGITGIPGVPPRQAAARARRAATPGVRAGLARLEA